jgi:serine/threonine-protein kinase HipA
MGRRKAHIPLNVLLNNRLVGRLEKEPNGAIEFAYNDEWLRWENAMPVSLSLPLRETRFIGAPVAAVFENLLPDSTAIRTRVAERVGAEGTDSYSLLAKIGRDCVGALQFLPDDEEIDASGTIKGMPVSESVIERILSNLGRAPLGLDSTDEEFRISVAGAQEKTALLWHKNKWMKPHGTTPTTHILKPEVGHIQTPAGAIDLSNSVENEFYCLKLIEAFGLPINNVHMHSFGEVKALVVERFDRRWIHNKRLIRLPQEDCCQALSVPPGKKYQNHGGPGIVDILKLLRGSDTPTEDQIAFFKSQILFWLMGATDGHAKNFSVFLLPGGRFRLTPFYDVLTAQPGLDAHQIQRKAFKLAMSVGSNRKYRITDIHGRHFVEIAKEAGLGPTLVKKAIGDIQGSADGAFATMEKALPGAFPQAIHDSVKAAVFDRLRSLTTNRGAIAVDKF